MKCFYHNADLDGKCSAAIVRLKYSNIELIGINYGDPFPWEDIAPREPVIMVDFSLQPFEEMAQLREITDHLVWIDHHKSALAEAEAVDWRTYEDPPDPVGAVLVPGLRKEGIGACALTWRYLFPNQALPYAVKLLAEYDVWNHSDPNCLPFQYGARHVGLEPADGVWEALLDDDHDLVRQITSDGALILSYQNKQNEIGARSKCFVTELDGLKLLAANHGPANSQFFDSLWDPEQHQAMCLFWWRPKIGQWTVSLYTTREDVDCSAVCKARGGGGHKGAAGFQCAELPFVLPNAA